MTKKRLKELQKEFDRLVALGEVTDVYDYCSEKGLSEEEQKELIAHN